MAMAGEEAGQTPQAYFRPLLTHAHTYLISQSESHCQAQC